MGDDDVSGKPKVLYKVEQIEGLTLPYVAYPQLTARRPSCGTALLEYYLHPRVKRTSAGGSEITRKRVISEIDRDEKRKTGKKCIIIF